MILRRTHSHYQAMDLGSSLELIIRMLLCMSMEDQSERLVNWQFNTHKQI